MTPKIILCRIGIVFFYLMTMPIMMAQSQSSGESIANTATMPAPVHIHIDYLTEPPEILSKSTEIQQELSFDKSYFPGPPTLVEKDAHPELVIPENQTYIMEAGEFLAPEDFIFFENNDLGTGAPTNFTSRINEPSVGTNGNLVFQSGNWYAALSTDNGNTFSFVNPFTTFPSINSGFCCDQEVIYDPSRDLMLWELQYIEDGNSNTQRIAVANGAANLAAGNWYYYDFNPQMLGLPNGRWFDYPHFSLGDNFLYLTTNVFTTAGDSWTNTVIMRIPLDGLASGGAFGFSFLQVTDRFNFTPVQEAGTTIYWASHNSTSSIRIYRWDESSGTIFWDNVAHTAYTTTNRGSAHCPGPDGRDWCGRFDDRIMTGWVANGVIGFMWNVAEGGAFPFPYVKITQFQESNRSLIGEPAIWSQGNAWAYPSVGVNARGHIGGTIFAGGGSIMPWCQAWIADDFNGGVLAPLENYNIVQSTDGPLSNVWGDYLRSRPHSTATNTWSATGYSLQGGGANSNARPRYVWFGRERDGTPVQVYTLTVQSQNPNSGVSITVSPNDNNGQGNGTTQFTRVYNSGVSVTLTAPQTAGGNDFLKWQRNGSDYSTNRTTSVTMSANTTMKVVYETPPPTGFLGDVNGDDLCNSTDALIVLSFDVGLTIPPDFLDRINTGFGDVNSDGLTNSTDALILLSFDVGIPVPFPVCEPFNPPTAATVYKEPTKNLGKKIGVTANHPVTTEITRGMIVEIPVNIDVSQYELELGSFTAMLEWDNTTLEFESFKGGRTNGFDNPTVNTKGTDKGKLVFASAVPQGSKGKVNVLNLKLKVIGKPGVRSALKLSFTAMAASKTFENLLPYLDSREIISTKVSIGNNPTKFKLENYPNPFNPTTKISYSLPVAGAVKIVIYNTLGQQVRVLVNQEQDAGQYSIEWDSRDDHNQTLSSGVYILRMQAEGFVKDKKLLLLK